MPGRIIWLWRNLANTNVWMKCVVQSRKANMSDIFPIKNGLKQWDALSPLLLNFALEYAIRKIKVKQDGWKLNGTHQLLVYADHVNILGRSIHTIKKNKAALVIASKETELKVNTDKTKYMVMSWDQNAGWSHSVIIVPCKGWKSSVIWEQS